MSVPTTYWSVHREYKSITGTEKSMSSYLTTNKQFLGDLCSLQVLGFLIVMYFVSENLNQITCDIR